MCLCVQWEQKGTFIIKGWRRKHPACCPNLSCWSVIFGCHLLSLHSQPPTFMLLRSLLSSLQLFNSDSRCSRLCYQPISWRPVQLGLQLSQSHRKCCINLLCNTQTRPKFIGYTACKVGIIWQSLALAGVDSVNNSVLISVFYWQQHHSENRQEVKLRTPIKRWGLRFLGTKVIFIEKGARLPPGRSYYVQTQKVWLIYQMEGLFF